MSEFEEFPKIARLSRSCVITEKLDGTNAQVHIQALGSNAALDPVLTLAVVDGLGVRAGSRNRWLTAAADNFGFARWAIENAPALVQLGEGRHFGEWWGSGIQRGYGLPKGEKRFSLFNVARWHAAGGSPRLTYSADPRLQPKSSSEAPACCSVVPVIADGIFDTALIAGSMATLAERGSMAAPGFMKPEGVVIYHEASGQLFKKTLEKDDAPKGRA